LTLSDLEGMRKASKVTGTILKEMCSLVKVGVTPNDIDAYAEKRCAELGSIPAFKGYKGFPKCVCISVNDEIVHTIPNDRRFQEGDIVKLDFGVIVDGYYGDAARTIPVGNVSLDVRRLMLTTQKALNMAIEVMVPGNYIGDISATIQSVAEGDGYHIVKNLCGHSIGRVLHDTPVVPNWGLPKTGPILTPGMFFAIEPIVNLGNPEMRLMEDKWTIKTTDGAPSAHFEETIVVTEEGPEILTRC
jgi:methionyl aminopeptidase